MGSPPSTNAPTTPQTPKTSSKRKAEPSTPAVARSIQASAPGHTMDLETARSKLVEYFREIPVVTLSDFFDNFISSVSSEAYEEIIKKLRADPQGITDEGKVYGYAEKKPSQDSAHEAAAFSCLGSFIKAVIKISGEHEGKKPLVGHSAKQTSLSSETVNTSRPDSYIYLLAKSATGDKAGWESLLAAGEFKKREKDARENWAQVLWGMHHIMRNDPCRCKTYGYSLEDDQARLWCYSRASVVVTEKFNWIKEPEHLVKFILAFSLSDAKHFTPPRNEQVTNDSGATVNDGSSPLSSPPRSPSPEVDATRSEGPCMSDEHQVRVGLDPTMRRVMVKNKIQYEIDVEDDCYVTEGVICDWKADCGIGRATRIWIVHLKDNPVQKFVLKDVWLEEGSTREGDTLDAIRGRVNELKNEKEPLPNLEEWFENHLLHKHSDQTIGKPVPGVGDPRKFLPLTGTHAAGQSIINSLHKGSQRTHPVGRPLDGNTEMSTGSDIMPSRFHYRIAFEGGAMDPLDAVPNLQSASQAVIGIFRGCWVLWKCGYIHRDISSSNALWDPKTKTGRLADFDYTTVFDKERRRSIRTGTPHFWSIEVEQGRFLRLPPPPQMKHSEKLVEIAAPQIPEPPFQHNVLHDLESIYWLSIWTMLWLVCNEDMVEGEVSPPREGLYNAVFSSRASQRRDYWITMPTVRNGVFRKWPDAFRNARMSNLVSVMHFYLFPDKLDRLFADLEAGLTTDESTVPPNSPVFSEAFGWIGHKLDEFDQAIKPFGESTVKPLRTFQLVLQAEGGPDEVERPSFYTLRRDESDIRQRSSKRQKTSDGRKDMPLSPAADETQDDSDK